MALINVMKKVHKAGDKLGLRPGEEVLAACTTNPTGTVKRMAAVQLGGIVGAAIAARGDKATEGPAEDSMAAAFPEGRLFLFVTDQRLMAASVSTMSGNPKELVAEWPRSSVASIEVAKGKLALPMTITFGDGSSVVCEGAKGTNPESLAEFF